MEASTAGLQRRGLNEGSVFFADTGIDEKPGGTRKWSGRFSILGNMLLFGICLQLLADFGIRREWRRKRLGGFLVPPGPPTYLC